jgi:hypothetical protein
VVLEKPRRFLFDEEPCAGATQRARYENGGQDNVHRMRLPQPGPYMASNRRRSEQEAIADDGQSTGRVDPPGEVDDESTDVADEECERDARKPS